VADGLVLPYVHNSMAPGMGSIGVLLGAHPPVLSPKIAGSIAHSSRDRDCFALQACRTCTN
jgi:hypothetical protein